MTDDLRAETEQFQHDARRIRAEIEKAIVGQDRVVECAVTAILAGGNVLLEGVPGLGKTELVKSLSRVLELDFRRIQFTPDLMPADVVGTSVLVADDRGGHRLEFRSGPVFTQLLLADEINRATPKTQAALLECMQEGSVTSGGETRMLQQPFFVLATQNPIEHEGTYELPEAQLDRFLFKVVVPFLDRDGLNAVLDRTTLGQRQGLERVVDGGRLLQMRGVLQRVVVAAEVRDYAVRLVLATHPDQNSAPERIQRYVRWGASPRAAQGLLAAGRVRALTAGRAHLACEDIRHFAREVLQHRVLRNYDGLAEEIATADLVGDVVEHVAETD